MTWTNSRLVLCPDGSTIPVLYIIAEHKYGAWDPNEYYPAWKEKGWTNESLDNVHLVKKAVPRNKRPANKSGFPAGTPEYYKWNRQQHPERQREYSRTAYLRAKEQKKADLELRAENARLRALLGAQTDEVVGPSLDNIINGYTPNVGGGSSQQSESPLVRQIGTPMEDD